jgi:hypothetical protein
MPKALDVPSRRTGLTLPHALNETLKRMAELQGKSKSGLILEFLVECEPAFNNLLLGLEAAQSNKNQAVKIVLDMQQQALSNLSDAMKDFNDNLEFDLGDKAE